MTYRWWHLWIFILVGAVLFSVGLLLHISPARPSFWLAIQDDETWFAVHVISGGYDAGLKFEPNTGWANLPEGSVQILNNAGGTVK